MGYTILKFLVTDADTAPNAAPYTFDIHSGNEGGAFRLEQDGILRTAMRFNHKFKENYLLHIGVYDNGTPPLYSDTYVVVKVNTEFYYGSVFCMPGELQLNSLIVDCGLLGFDAMYDAV